MLRKKILTVCSFLLILCLSGFSAGAEQVVTANVATEYFSEDLFVDDTQAVSTSTVEFSSVAAKGAILMEASTGRVLFEQNADEAMSPASVTKIMSLLLVMEAIDAGKFTLDSKITASEHACSMGGSQIWLEPGEEMTVDDLLKATCVASANDATVALGEAVAGSEASFVALMNQRAKELGMENTNFVNCTGLDATGHVISARDIAIMSRQLLQHDLIKNYTTIWMDTLRDGQSELVNTNKLVRFYSGATGLKTGTTSTAGYCLSASAERDGMELIAVVLSAASSKERFAIARQMLDYGFANYAVTTPAVDSAQLQPLSVSGGVLPQVSLTTEPISLLTAIGDATKLEAQYQLAGQLEAPVAAGQSVGEIVYTLNGEEVGRQAVTAAQDVPRLTYWRALSSLFQAVFAL